MSEWVPDELAIEVTEAIQEQMRKLVKAAPPNVNFEVTLSVDGNPQVWRYIGGQTV